MVSKQMLVKVLMLMRYENIKHAFQISKLHILWKNIMNKYKLYVRRCVMLEFTTH